MLNNKLIIFGTGEIAELAYYYFKHDSNYKIVAFTADDEYVNSNTFKGLPLIPFSEITEKYSPKEYNAHVALSYNKLNQIRAEKYYAVKEKGYKLVSYVCSKSFYWPDLSIGDNCFILENQTIQPTVKIGNNVMIWSGNHLGHGCQIKDHVYISSHVCISGHTIIDEYCFVGVNATFKDFIKIGKRVFITMDASVVKNIKDDAVVIGARCKILKSGDPLAIMLKQNYFNLGVNNDGI